MITKFKIFENNKVSSIEDFKNYAILYDNEESVMNIAKILKYLGFEVFEPNLEDYKHWKGFHYVKYKGKEYFVLSGCSGDEKLDYDEFIDIVKNKFKINIDDILKNEFNEIDPYGEENWDIDRYKWLKWINPDELGLD